MWSKEHVHGDVVSDLVLKVICVSLHVSGPRHTLVAKSGGSLPVWYATLQTLTGRIQISQQLTVRGHDGGGSEMRCRFLVDETLIKLDKARRGPKREKLCGLWKERTGGGKKEFAELL
jgi:hypothetical protein